MGELADSRVLIGTSGFSYPDWKGAFYPEKLASRGWLRFYAERFHAVEINSTFYRPASASTLMRWREEAPEGFAFVLKASRAITHDKKLIDCKPDLEAFIHQHAPMGRQWKGLLFQLPPSMKVDHARLSEFLEAASAVFDSMEDRPRPAMEFRHPSWHGEETLDLLQRHGWTFVVHDMNKAAGWTAVGNSLLVGERRWRLADFLERDAPFLYLRFHGATAKYQGEYGEDRLKPWAEAAGRARRRGALVMAFFNNTMAAAAPGDAATFERLLGGGPTSTEPPIPWKLRSG